MGDKDVTFETPCFSCDTSQNLTIETPCFSCDTSQKLTIETVSVAKAPVTAEEINGDFHFSGTIILTLKGTDNNKYHVRTLLDTGCGTNLICADLLSHVRHEVIGTTQMNIAGINTSETKSTSLVRVFIDNDDCPIKSIKCFTMPNLLPYNINSDVLAKAQTDCGDLPNCCNLLMKADHDLGMGIILGPGEIKDISSKEPYYKGNYLVETTYFGIAISGRLPHSSIINSYSASLYRFNENMQQMNHFYNENDINYKLELLENLEFLSDKEALGVKKSELHYEDKLCMEKF